MITGCYQTMSCSSRVERLQLLGSAVLTTVYIYGSYMRHTQHLHDLSSSDVDPCELLDSLCGVMVKSYHCQLTRSLSVHLGMMF